MRAYWWSIAPERQRSRVPDANVSFSSSFRFILCLIKHLYNICTFKILNCWLVSANNNSAFLRSKMSPPPLPKCILKFPSRVTLRKLDITNFSQLPYGTETRESTLTGRRACYERGVFASTKQQIICSVLYAEVVFIYQVIM